MRTCQIVVVGCFLLGMRKSKLFFPRRSRSFLARSGDRERGAAASAGATLGATVGSVLGGPRGAAVGGAVGAVLGVLAAAVGQGR